MMSVLENPAKSLDGKNQSYKIMIFLLSINLTNKASAKLLDLEFFMSSDFVTWSMPSHRGTRRFLFSVSASVVRLHMFNQD